MKINYVQKMTCIHARNSLIMALTCVSLVACRGEDVAEDTRFPQTQDPNSFVSFLNQAPGVPRNGELIGSIDNVKDFPEAYYNTIDPASSRNTLNKWRIENGFLNPDLSIADCDPTNCRTTHVTFRDTKDLGYGRSMFMRWNTVSNDVAVYVENFQVDAVPGVPYGELNYEALVANDRSWNFGVNAIEFSAYPAPVGNKQFTKFYNFAGDGKRATSASGVQQHFVDLDNRGDKSMPVPCIVCHGGHGRTLVYENIDGVKKLAPTITGGVPGDVQAHMQSIELNTLQFADKQGFTKADNMDGIRLINAAVLETYKQRLSTYAPDSGDWNPALAIEIAQGRYNGNINIPDSSYDDNFVPSDWQGGVNESLYTTTLGPNCMVCHSLRGSGLNPSLSFKDLNELTPFIKRIDHLVYEQGKMPLGLLNYSDFWDKNSVKPAVLASTLGLARTDSNGAAIKPGKPVAVITAPPIATGFNSTTGQVYNIPISGSSTAFKDGVSYAWSLPFENNTVIEQGLNPAEATIKASVAGDVEISLTVTSADGIADNTRFTIEIADEVSPTISGLDSPPPASEITFYGGPDSIQTILNSQCIACHIPSGGNPGIPLYYQACGDPDNKDAYDFLYRSVLARVNFSSPQDSLFLRKPTNGSTDFQRSGRAANTIPNYHGGSNAVDDAEFSRLVSWVLSDAPKGDNPTAAPECF